MGRACQASLMHFLRGSYCQHKLVALKMTFAVLVKDNLFYLITTSFPACRSCCLQWALQLPLPMEPTALAWPCWWCQASWVCCLPCGESKWNWCVCVCVCVVCTVNHSALMFSAYSMGWLLHAYSSLSCLNTACILWKTIRGSRACAAAVANYMCKHCHIQWSVRQSHHL